MKAEIVVEYNARENTYNVRVNGKVIASTNTCHLADQYVGLVKTALEAAGNECTKKEETK